MPSSDEKPKQRRTLTRDKIFTTSLALLDKKGAEALNMRNIAAELGVRPSALYRHISGRDDILTGIRVLIADEVVYDDFDFEPWDEALVTLGYSYRNVFAAHPEAVPLLATTPLTSAGEVVLIYDRFLQVLISSGWSAAEALDIMNAFDSFLLGSALDLASGQEILNPGEQIDAQHFQKAYADRMQRNSARGISGAESAFEFGLKMFIAGLRATNPAA